MKTYLLMQKIRDNQKWIAKGFFIISIAFLIGIGLISLISPYTVQNVERIYYSFGIGMAFAFLGACVECDRLNFIIINYQTKKTQ